MVSKRKHLNVSRKYKEYEVLKIALFPAKNERAFTISVYPFEE